jgi:hypothetical protein
MRFKILLWIILLSFFPGLAPAQNDKDALVQELFIKSGMEKQFEQLPLIIQAGFDRLAKEDEHLQKLPKNLLSSISALAREAFAPESLKAAMLPELKAQLTVQDMKQVLKWLDSPLGRKCTDLEVAAATPEAEAEMEQYGAQIRKSPPAAPRLAVLKKLDGALAATDSAAEVAIGSQVAVALAINATLPREQQRPLAEIRREMQKTRHLVEAEARAQTLIALLYTYRSLSEAQLRQYLEFLKSPAGSKFMSVSTAAFNEAFFHNSIKWGQAIGEAMKQAEKQAEV